MPRKYLRKVLPSHDTLRNHRYLQRLGPRLGHHRLWQLHRRSVAGGVAVGMVSGLVPGSNPVQFLVAAAGAVALRVNLPLAVLATLYSNPFTILPLYYAAFRLGVFITGADADAMPDVSFSLGERGWSELVPAALEWLASLGKPLAIGIPSLALLLGAAAYVLVDWSWRIAVVVAWYRRGRRRVRSARRENGG